MFDLGAQEIACFKWRFLMQEKIAAQSMSWKNELATLVAEAKSSEESAALSAFQKALTPYLDEPSSLRTLLGKIQSVLLSRNEENAVRGEYASLEELQSTLSENVKAIAA